LIPVDYRIDLCAEAAPGFSILCRWPLFNFRMGIGLYGPGDADFPVVTKYPLAVCIKVVYHIHAEFYDPRHPEPSEEASDTAGREYFFRFEKAMK